MESLGLYIHIPFCREKCAYCDFYSLRADEETYDNYVAALKKDLICRAAAAKEYWVDTVYFGGGTPTVLGAARLSRLLHTVFAHYRVTADAEITLEANPESARDEAALQTLREAGFNRISMGLQSADDELLRRLGRIHTKADAADAVRAIKSAGFTNFSLDLMYALPGQSMAQWRGSLAFAVALQPKHISCYALTLEEGTPLFRERAKYAFPDDDMAADMYIAAVEALKEQGYRQYEISNFAKEGYASHHNLRYWKLKPYLGLGPGAAGDFGGVRYAYARRLADYIAGHCPYSEESPIDAAERRREKLMLSLRTTAGISLAEFPELKELFIPYIKAGLAGEKNGCVSLTPRGFLVSNAIITEALNKL